MHILCISFFTVNMPGMFGVWHRQTEYDYIDGDSLTAGSWFVVNPDRLMAVEARVCYAQKERRTKKRSILGHGMELFAGRRL